MYVLIDKMFISNIILCAIVFCCMCFVENVYGKTTATKDAIETHPNVNLLPQSCGYYTNGRRIYGGNNAKLYEFPWMALISYKGDFGVDFDCGGTIINSKYILTAGHCVLGKSIVGIRVGEYNIRYKTDCQGEKPVCESHLQDIRVESIIRHQNYTDQRSDTRNDIALIRLEKPIDFNNKNVLPICLPVTQELRNIRLAGMLGTVTGWGLTESRYYSDVLLKVKVLIQSEEECASLIYNRSLAGDSERVLKEICAGENGKDSCSGDSGGPLMIEGEYDEDIRYIQYGIVSRGLRKCGMEPGIYTDVTKFIGWILENIKE